MLLELLKGQDTNFDLHMYVTNTVFDHHFINKVIKFE